MKETCIGKKGGRMIQFLHANAYPPGCYLKYFEGLSDFDVRMPIQRPLWESSNIQKFRGWKCFVNDIEAHMAEHDRQDVIGMGHSMGGIVSLLSAIQKPERFSQLILIDPVIIPGTLASILSRLPYSVVRKFVPMVDIAARRKDLWPSREQLRTYLLTKKVFQRFDPSVLEDFISHGMKVSSQGITLAFPREWESHIYATAPNVWTALKKIKVPVTIIKAQYSDVITDKRWQQIHHTMPAARLIEFPNAGHLMPFERPKELSEVVRSVLRS